MQEQAHELGRQLSEKKPIMTERPNIITGLPGTMRRLVWLLRLRHRKYAKRRPPRQ